MAATAPIPPITEIGLKGFKSFAEEQRLEIRPLTLLAGANSSGKSSALQPVLLLKQTLEAPYDPGPLLLDGDHVKFTDAGQLLSRFGKIQSEGFEVFVQIRQREWLREFFQKSGDGGFDLLQTSFTTIHQAPKRGKLTQVDLREGMSARELGRLFLPPELKAQFEDARAELRVQRFQCLLRVAMVSAEGQFEGVFPASELSETAVSLRSILHVPGLRGIPARSYSTAAVAEPFRGTFETYMASVILSWQQSRDERASSLSKDLACLGLTWGVRAKALDATQVELTVGRLPGKKRSSDLVNIADVGFGVSQVLPVLVALRAARPGQLVYIEQPEIHLHPRAVEGLAAVFAEAALRDVRVVIETHSSLLLLAIQALVAEGKLPSDKVCLHWFRRDAKGATRVESADLDRQGAYGDWPEDFWNVMAGVETRYVEAAEKSALTSGDDQA